MELFGQVMALRWLEDYGHKIEAHLGLTAINSDGSRRALAYDRREQNRAVHRRRVAEGITAGAGHLRAGEDQPGCGGCRSPDIRRDHQPCPNTNYGRIMDHIFRIVWDLGVVKGELKRIPSG